MKITSKINSEYVPAINIAALNSVIYLAIDVLMFMNVSLHRYNYC